MGPSLPLAQEVEEERVPGQHLQYAEGFTHKKKFNPHFAEIDTSVELNRTADESSVAGWGQHGTRL